MEKSAYNSRVPEPLLPTKLFIPPQRPFLVPRPRLIDRLAQGRSGKVTLVAAPAGFGKTTLVTSWLAHSPPSNERRPAAWLSLDENDNLFPHFFTYFIAAMQTVYPGLAQGLLSSLQMTPPPDDGAILPVLLYELGALDKPLLLVLDDYHLVTNETIHDAINALIEYMPPSLHLVIISREEPPLSLPRWRVRGQLNEVRAADLRFTLDEAAVFLEQTMGLHLADSAIAQLEKHTEGWVAGLQLAALSLRDATNGEGDDQSLIANFSGRDRHVADYLIQEVLQRQRPEVQAFLLRTSLLDRFCAELCDTLLDSKIGGQEDGEKAGPSPANPSKSAQILDHLESANLFLVPLDARRHWYRYHHLFAQLLQDRLLREVGQVRVDNLYRRASRWFSNQALFEEGIHYAIRGGDVDEAARLLASMPADSLWDQGRTSLFKRSGQQIPADALRRHPRSLVFIAAAYLITGDIHQFNTYLALCEGIESIYGEYALLKSTLIRNEGNFVEALHLAREAGEFLPEDATMMRAVALIQIANNLLRLGGLDQAGHIVDQAWELIVKGGNASPNMRLQIIQMQGAVALMRADIYQAQLFFREGLALAEGAPAGTPPMVGIMHAGLGRVHYEWNELDEAAAAYAQARTWADRTGISDIQIATLIGEIEMLCQQREAAAVESHLENLRKLGRQGPLQDVMDQMGSLTAIFYLRLGKLDEALRWANSSGLKLTDRPVGSHRVYYQALVAVRLAECRSLGTRDGLSQMVALLDHLIQQAQAGHYQNSLIDLHILQALVLDYRGDEAAARQALQKALELAQPGNLVRTFLDHGPALSPLLARMEGSYSQRLSRAFRQELEEQGNKMASPPLDLTPREYEVLLEITAGLSNKEIEEKLVISRNTVRTHIKNLYRKLEVSSRTQAVRKARELKLV